MLLSGQNDKNSRTAKKEKEAMLVTQRESAKSVLDQTIEQIVNKQSKDQKTASNLRQSRSQIQLAKLDN